MRVAFFSDTYRPNVDGVVTSMEALRNNLEKKGHKVKYFVPCPKNKEDKGDGAVYAPSIEFPPYPQYRIAYKREGVVKSCLGWKPDIIHSHAMATMALAARDAAKKSNAPVVGTFHTMLPKAVHYLTSIEGLQEWGEHLSWRYLKWLYNGFDGLISPSKYVEKILRMHGIESKVIPSGIDTEKFTPAKARSLEKEPAFLCTGRVVREKNLDYVITLAKANAMRKAGAKFVIVGDGPYREELSRKAGKAIASGKISKGAIRFVGKVDFEELLAYYRNSHALIFPSTFETQGLVAIESMACGTPVVALEDSAAAEIVENWKTGALIRQDADLEHNAEKILRLAGMKGKLKKACRKRALEYDSKKCAKKVIALYESLA